MKSSCRKLWFLLITVLPWSYLNAQEAAFSPDGHWISGRWTIRKAPECN